MALLSLLGAVEFGPYTSWWKALIPVVVLVLWLRVLTWMDKDAIAARLPRELVMGGMLGGMCLAFMLFYFMPGFLVALGVLLGIMVIEAGVYLGIRNATVGLSDLKGEMGSIFKGAGGGPKAAKAVEGAVSFMTSSGDLIEAPTEEDPAVVAYAALQQMLTQPLFKGAEQIDLTAVEGAMQSKSIIDGVTYAGTTLDRNTAGMAVDYIKSIAKMNVEDRRKPQVGNMKVMLDNKKYELMVSTRGTTAGETMTIFVNFKNKHDFNLETIGMLEDQSKKVFECIQDGAGIVLLATPPKQGLTTLGYSMIRGHDAYLQHIQTIEREPQADLEGITQNKLGAGATAADEIKQVTWVTSQQPDTLLVTEVTDPKSAQELVKFASEGHRVYVGMRSGSALDAITEWRKLVGNSAPAAQVLKMVVCGRVIRKLCSACKVGYAPEPERLRKLNMDPAKVGQLFQARTQPIRDQKGNVIPCEFCKDMHFKGRTGVYELFTIDDEARQILGSGGSINQLAALMRKHRNKTLLENAMKQVEIGETSIDEVLRVLKPPAPPQMGAAKPPAAPPKAPPKA